MHTFIGRILSAALLLSLCTGCILGPQSLRHSRMNYNRVVQKTAREEMLLNLVRMRYHQSVDFIRVPSITSQFNYNASLAHSETFNGTTPNSLGLGFRAETKPTIVYAPEQEQEFNKRLFSPISLETIELLSSQGWAIDRVLRVTVKKMNNVDNAESAGGPTPKVKPQFEEFLYITSLLRNLQSQNHSVELAYENRELSKPVPRSAPIPIKHISPQDYITAEENGLYWEIKKDLSTATLFAKTSSTKVPVLRIAKSMASLHETDEIHKRLRLKKTADMTYRLKSDSEGQLNNPGVGDNNELNSDVTISPRSFYEMMFYLSHSIDVPCCHVEQGLVRQTYDAEGNSFDWNEMTKGLFKVHMSKQKPADSAVAVKHRGYWFYIDESDLDSKSTFNLLLELFNLEIRAGGGAQIPLLTI